MRLFIGVELDEAVKAAAADAAARLRRRLTRAVPALQARWVPPENLHITLWFIGEVADPQVEELTGALQRAPFDVRPFQLTAEGWGAFPPSGAPRVLWIGVTEGAWQMTAIYSELTARLAPLGYEPEKRRYSAHLTMARVKEPGRGTTAAVRKILSEAAAGCGTCRIAAVTLFQSHLSPKGATYEPRLRVPLDDAGAPAPINS
jgi:2'-5' RNA ligase